MIAGQPPMNGLLPPHEVPPSLQFSLKSGKSSMPATGAPTTGSPQPDSTCMYQRVTWAARAEPPSVKRVPTVSDDVVTRAILPVPS